MNYAIAKSPSGKSIIVHVDRLMKYFGELPRIWKTQNSVCGDQLEPENNTEPVVGIKPVKSGSNIREPLERTGAALVPVETEVPMPVQRPRRLMKPCRNNEFNYYALMTSRNPRQLLTKRADDKYSFRVLTSTVPHRHKNSMFCQLCGARYETKQGLRRHSRYVHLVKWCASGQLLALSAAELERLDFDRRRNQLRGGKQRTRIEMKRDASEAEEPETNNLAPGLESNNEIVEEPVHTVWNETTNITQERPLNLVDIATILDDLPKENSQSEIQLSTLSTRMLPFGVSDEMTDMRFNEFRREDTYLEPSSAEIHPLGKSEFNSSEVWIDLLGEGKQPQPSTIATVPEKPIITFVPEDPHIVSITPVSQATKLTDGKQKENESLNEMVWRSIYRMKWCQMFLWSVLEPWPSNLL